MNPLAVKTIALTISCAAFHASGQGAAAQSPTFIDNHNVSFITMKDGLPTNHIDDIYKDSYGFLWISLSGGGLARYDGYDFVNFSPNSSRYGIKSGFVRNVAEDRFHRLWAVSECGVDIIDLLTLNTLCSTTQNQSLQSILNIPAQSVTCDNEGKIWISSTDSLRCVAFDDCGEVVDIKSIKPPTSSHIGIIVRDVEKNGTVWMGAGGTVSRVTYRPGNQLSVTPVSDKLTQLPEVDYFSDFEAKENEIWISTNHGLYRYDIVNDMVKHYLHRQGDETSLSQNFLTDIAITDTKQLMVSSLKGINIYNPMTDSFEHIDEGTGTLNNPFINMMLPDGDRVFIGTEGGGINVLTLARLHLTTFTHSPSDAGSLSPNPVNSIAYGPDGSLFVGTVEGGLNRLKPGSKEFTHYTDADGTLSHNSVSAIAVDGENRLWVGTWGGGLDILDSRNPHKVIRHIPSLGNNDCKISFIGTLIYDRLNNGMWIGSNHGLLFYDCRSGSLTQGITPRSDEETFGFIGAAIDRENRLWAGCSGGLLIIDLTKRENDGIFPHRSFKYKLDNPCSNTPERVSCIHMTADGNIWIGTTGYGLYRHSRDRDRDIFTNYTTADGLVNNTVKGILSDNDGRLWIATINGLSCMTDDDTPHFTNYSMADGLPGDQFYWNASCSGPDGQLLFGTTCGLLSLTPHTVERETIVPQVVFTRLSINNQPVTPPLWQNNR